jgi:hypothetical protein
MSFLGSTCYELASFWKYPKTSAAIGGAAAWDMLDDA